MAYIGKTPVIGNFQKCDAIAVVNGQAAYTLQVGGSNVSPQSENHMLVSLNGILQAPVDSFTVSGSTLTFASNLITGDVIDFVMILGNVLDLGVPSDNTVSLAKLTATGTKDATTFLRGDNTFASAGGTNTPAWFVKKSAVQSISANTFTDVTYDVEVVDTDNAFASNVFTVPSGQGGKYLVFGQCRFETNVDFDGILSIIAVNGTRTLASWGNNVYYNFVNITGILDLSAGDVVKHVCLQDSGGALNLGNADQGTVTFFGGYKIIE